MVLNGRIKTGNVTGDLRAIPVTSESAGRRPKSGTAVRQTIALNAGRVARLMGTSHSTVSTDLLPPLLLLCPPTLLPTILELIAMMVSTLPAAK